MCAVWRDFEALISAQHLIKAKAHSAEVEQTIKYTPKNKNGNIKLEHKLLLHIMRLIVLWENCAVCAKYSCVPRLTQKGSKCQLYLVFSKF